MKIPFRQYHLLELLRAYEKGSLPVDVLMGQYFRMHKSLGSKDKKFISEIFYGLIRWKRLIDHFCPQPPSWENRITWFLDRDIESFSPSQIIHPSIRVSFPEIYFQLIEKNYGQDKAIEICFACNETAPTMIRVNPLKTTREALLEKWKNVYQVRASSHSQLGILFDKKINFFELKEFHEGLFEVQDEASQLVSLLVNPSPNQQVMDYCAGAGGKTLAFAPLMENKGQIYLHDVRKKALAEAKKRLARAGIQNAQICHADDPKMQTLKNKMDVVLVDVPCTGSGTLRRSPDLKWKFSMDAFQDLVLLQREIFSKAFTYLKPNGKIVYTTCSILQEENEDQIKYFLDHFPLKLEGESFKSLPLSGQMDGFFGGVLSKNT